MLTNGSLETSSRLESDGLLAHLWNTPFAYAVVLTPEAEIVRMNDATKRAFLGRTDVSVEGVPLRSFYNEGIVHETVGLFQRVLATETPHVLRVLRRGVGFEFTLVPFCDGRPKARAVLGLARRGRTRSDELDPAVPVFESKFVGLGRLYVLTPRELEVLALLREPLTLAQIAARLSRAMKTIDHHVTSIREKLNVHSRVEMLRLADEADLQLSHAAAIRYSE